MYAREKDDYIKFKDELSKLLAKKRKEKGLSLRQVEKETKIFNRTILNYEQDSMPSSYHLLVLMEFYGISFEEIKELYDKCKEL